MQTNLRVRLLIVKLETKVGGMLALLIQLEDINSVGVKLELRHIPFLQKSHQWPASYVMCQSYFDCFIYSAFLTINFARTSVFPTVNMSKKMRVFVPVCMGVMGHGEGNYHVGEPIYLLEVP